MLNPQVYSAHRCIARMRDVYEGFQLLAMRSASAWSGGLFARCILLFLKTAEDNKPYEAKTLCALLLPSLDAIAIRSSAKYTLCHHVITHKMIVSMMILRSRWRVRLHNSGPSCTMRITLDGQWLVMHSVELLRHNGWHRRRLHICQSDHC
jgi:hypothetical protein